MFRFVIGKCQSTSRGYSAKQVQHVLKKKLTSPELKNCDHAIADLNYFNKVVRSHNQDIINRALMCRCIMETDGHVVTFGNGSANAGI